MNKMINHCFAKFWKIGELKMEEEKKVVHEVKLDKSIIKLLWVFAVVLLLNALPDDMLIPEASAQNQVYSEMERAATFAIRNYFSCTNINGLATTNREMEEVAPGSWAKRLTIFHVSTGVCW